MTTEDRLGKALAGPADGTRQPSGSEPDSETSGPGKLEQSWIVAVVGYSVIRFVAAWGALGEHGANPWIFGVIDVGSAYPYAKAVAKVAKTAASRDWRGMRVPAIVAIAMFFAPYAYLWIAANEAPQGLKTGLALAITVLGIAAVLGVVSQTRRLRAESADPVVTDG